MTATIAAAIFTGLAIGIACWALFSIAIVLVFA